MEIKPIKTEADYQAALDEIERIFDAKSGTQVANNNTISIIAKDDPMQALGPPPKGKKANLGNCRVNSFG